MDALVQKGEDIGGLDEPGKVISHPSMLFEQAETLRLAGMVHYSRGRLEEAFVLLMRFCRLYDVIVCQCETQINPLKHVDSIDKIRGDYATAVARLDDLDVELQEKFAVDADRPPSVVWSYTQDELVDCAGEPARMGSSVAEKASVDADAHAASPARADTLLARLRAALADDAPWPLSRQSSSTTSMQRQRSLTSEIQKKAATSRSQAIREGAVAAAVRQTIAAQPSESAAPASSTTAGGESAAPAPSMTGSFRSSLRHMAGSSKRMSARLLGLAA